MTIYDPKTDDVVWLNIDDPVMGGRSSSHTAIVEVRPGEQVLRFAGNVSLENSGVFFRRFRDVRPGTASAACACSRPVPN